MEQTDFDTRWTDHLRKASKAKESPARPTPDLLKSAGELHESGSLERSRLQLQQVSRDVEAEESQNGGQQAARKGYYYSNVILNLQPCLFHRAEASHLAFVTLLTGI